LVIHDQARQKCGKTRRKQIVVGDTLKYGPFLKATSTVAPASVERKSDPRHYALNFHQLVIPRRHSYEHRR
jgi:hypothetical protein